MTLTYLHGYPDRIGKRFAWAGYGAGPAVYNSALGDPITLPGFQNYIDTVNSALSVSGNYLVSAVPSVAGARANWSLFWTYSGAQGVNSLAISAAGTGQTNGTYLINATGGGGSGAQAQVVIAGGAVTGATIVKAGRGYTSAPTFTVAAGGTPGTLTATAAPASGSVPNGTNLSGESVQLGGLGGTY
jgi:hypothetical protein